MKTAIITISQISEGNGCMLAQRFTGECWRCDRVQRCTNKQALRGRIELYEKRLYKLTQAMNNVTKLLEKARLDFDENKDKD